MNGGGTRHEAAKESFREIASGLGTCLRGDFTRPAGKRGYRLTVHDYGSGTLILSLS